MRVMLATFGVGMVPLAWYTALELGMNPWACHLTAMMVLFGALFPLVVFGGCWLMLMMRL